MPRFAAASRTRLLRLARPLAEAARRRFADPTVRAAADTVDATRDALARTLLGARPTQAALDAAVDEALDAEAGLDRRVVALGRALDALADLGDGPADTLSAILFPVRASTLTEPSGRPQAPAYTQLADALDAHADPPALARLAPHPATLAADLRAFADTLSERGALRDAALADAAAARDATEALRDALQHLDRAVALAAGGSASPAHRAWSATAARLD
jgi:hypothetical protein